MILYPMIGTYLGDVESAWESGESHHGAGEDGAGQDGAPAGGEGHQGPGQQVERRAQLDHPQDSEAVCQLGREHARCRDGDGLDGMLLYMQSLFICSVNLYQGGPLVAAVLHCLIDDSFV